MNPDKPVSPEVAALIPTLANTMKFATQALAQSSAIAEVLIEKGILTKAELDARMGAVQKLKDSLIAVLDQETKKQS
ncbi:MAG TPA: hypothetical protein VMU26_11480 [Candidatus Polarisedimenticolia bacterium]|jgi:hypothetical protein|nr:hypothetical protein [Candidatus Polarisedimenticolia bacterium]